MGSATGKSTGKPTGEKRCRAENGSPVSFFGATQLSETGHVSRAAPGMSTATQTSAFDGQRIAVLVPCFNEEASIARVVAAFRAALPAAEIYVYDNNSTDRTIELARAAGALVRREAHQGKGNVVRRMFSDVDADVYVLVDGDATYDAASAGGMIERLLDGRLDMVVAARVDHEQKAYRLGHRTGNRLLTGFFSSVFHAPSPTSCPAFAFFHAGL